jgi:hypothetical protein
VSGVVVGNGVTHSSSPAASPATPSSAGGSLVVCRRPRRPGIAAEITRRLGAIARRHRHRRSRGYQFDYGTATNVTVFTGCGWRIRRQASGTTVSGGIEIVGIDATRGEQDVYGVANGTVDEAGGATSSPARTAISAARWSSLPAGPRRTVSGGQQAVYSGTVIDDALPRPSRRSQAGGPRW